LTTGLKELGVELSSVIREEYSRGSIDKDPMMTKSNRHGISGYGSKRYSPDRFRESVRDYK
jgi:hypothetical protein